MSRTLRTRWLMPEGLTASAGAGGISETSIGHRERSQISVRFIWYSREMGSASPAGKLPGRRHSAKTALCSAAVEAVLLVEPALVVHCPAARIEIALLGIETTLLMPIGPLALLVAPIMRVARRRSRFPVMALPMPCKTSPAFWAFAGSVPNRSVKEQITRDNLTTIPSLARSTRRPVDTGAAVPNTAARASVPPAILLPLDRAQWFRWA